MESLLNILPDAITYLASGFAFLAGFYFIIDKRFDFFSDISFSVMLVLGFICTNFLQAIPTPFVISNSYFRSILIFVVSGIVGLLIAIIRNVVGASASKFVIKIGRRKTSSSFFWYDRLDAMDKPVTLRLVNYEQQYIFQGILLSIDEAQENPYLLLGYCKKYDLGGHLIDRQYEDDTTIQCVVRADTFQEIYLMYDKDSNLKIEINRENETG